MTLRFTRSAARRVLAEALGDDDQTISRDELYEAAREAGIDEAHVDRAVSRAGRRRIAVAVAVPAVCIGAVMFVARDPQRLQIHNEQSTWIDVVVFAPKHPGDCERPADLRYGPRSFCVHAELRLAPNERQHVTLPADDECPVVWLRAGAASALFAMPASVEVERSGSLDQKGLGAPAMFRAPGSRFDMPTEACGRSGR